MPSRVGYHEGGQPNIPPSSSSLQDVDDQQNHRRKRELDSNQQQSNQRRRIDETSAVDNNNNGSGSSVNEAYDRQVEEDPIYGSDINADDDERTSMFENIFLFDGWDADEVVHDPRNLEPLLLHSLFQNTEGMGYEELIELQERMGRVERGLSEETISSHLKTRVHTSTASVDSTKEESEICTICQDEYENKDKIGGLECNHEYHEGCITQWLVLKNVCPICKGQGLKITTEENSSEVSEYC